MVMKFNGSIKNPPLIRGYKDEPYFTEGFGCFQPFMEVPIPQIIEPFADDEKIYAKKVILDVM